MRPIEVECSLQGANQVLYDKVGITYVKVRGRACVPWHNHGYIMRPISLQGIYIAAEDEANRR